MRNLYNVVITFLQSTFAPDIYQQTSKVYKKLYFDMVALHCVNGKLLDSISDDKASLARIEQSVIDKELMYGENASVFNALSNSIAV